MRTGLGCLLDRARALTPLRSPSCSSAVVAASVCWWWWCVAAAALAALLGSDAEETALEVAARAALPVVVVAVDHVVDLRNVPTVVGPRPFNFDAKYRFLHDIFQHKNDIEFERFSLNVSKDHEVLHIIVGVRQFLSQRVDGPIDMAQRRVGLNAASTAPLRLRLRVHERAAARRARRARAQLRGGESAEGGLSARLRGAPCLCAAHTHNMGVGQRHFSFVTISKLFDMKCFQIL